jgi:phosphoglycerate dehydrogenase-like enzyme
MDSSTIRRDDPVHDQLLPKWRGAAVTETVRGRQVGFVGLGNMGIPMTGYLVAAGYHVRGFDTSPSAVENFEAIGSSDAGGGVTAVADLPPDSDHTAIARWLAARTAE